MAFSEVYVDPSIAADSGTGTIGDPFGDLEYAIEQTTFDTTNGTRVNIKAGTAEVLVSDIATAMADTSVTAAWAPAAQPCMAIFQGYTAAAGDGGRATISGGGATAIYSSTTYQGVVFADLVLTNTGTVTHGLLMDRYCHLLRCEVHNMDSTTAAVSFDSFSRVEDCYIHNVGGTGISGPDITVERCYLQTGPTYDFTAAILTTSGRFASNNIIVVTGAADGIDMRNNTVLVNNTIYSDGGAGRGIALNGNNGPSICLNNVVEGFSGVGGAGVTIADPQGTIMLFGGNAVYNCTTAYDSLTDDVVIDYGDNETLTASPFNDAANGDFSPVDTGNVKEGSLPNIIGGGLV